MVTPSSSETVRAYPAAGLLRVIFWLVTKGWFGNLILWRGVETTLTISPNVEVDVEPNPTAVPTPIDSWGLKNTLLFISESNPSVCIGILNVFGIRFTFVPTVCTPETAPLLTLNILFSLKVLRTNNFSVPMPILLPTDIWFGILETYKSVTTPVVDEFGTSWYKIVLAVSNPITCEPFKVTIPSVLSPEITTVSPLFNGGDVEINADTWL